MLDEYILRGYAISAICRNCPMTDYCRMTGESCEDIKRIIAIPAANVAEVGYCSECVYHYDDGDHKCKKLRIPCPDDFEFFCKYGKKKEVNRMANDDYIKRSELIEHFRNYNPNWGVIDKDTVLDDIRDFPAADAEPVKHGHWIPINRINPAWGQFGIAQHKCSECGSEEVIARKRCPECGAKMMGEEDDDC